MVVGLSCARALGTALESEGRSKPTRQDSRRPVENVDSRLRAYCSCWMPKIKTSNEKTSHTYIYVYVCKIWKFSYEKSMEKNSSKIK